MHNERHSPEKAGSLASLSSIVDRARTGDLNACETIVRRFQDMAVGYAYAQLGDFHLAEVVTLFYMGERSQSEVARFLGISVDTVKNRLRSGREKLQKGLLDMTDKALRDHAPSRDDSFATVVNLCNAARAGDLPRVQQLLNADPALATRTISQNGQLAIQGAAREGHAAIVRLLLEAGANPLQGIYPNRGATSALACARDREHAEIVKLIEEHLEQNPPPQPQPDQAARLLAAVADDDLDAAKELLEADPALANAEANAEAAQKLRGDEIPANRPAIFPLRLASQLGLLDMARLLLEAGADPDAAFDMDLGDEGNYRNAGEPHWLAAAGQHPDHSALLLERGARTDLPENEPWAKPLAWAEKRGHDEIVELLRQRGATR